MPFQTPVAAIAKQKVGNSINFIRDRQKMQSVDVTARSRDPKNASHQGQIRISGNSGRQMEDPNKAKPLNIISAARKKAIRITLPHIRIRHGHTNVRRRRPHAANGTYAELRNTRSIGRVL